MYSVLEYTPSFPWIEGGRFSSFSSSMVTLEELLFPFVPAETDLRNRLRYPFFFFFLFVCLLSLLFIPPSPPYRSRISISSIKEKFRNVFFVFLLTPSLPPSLYNHWTTPCIFRTSLLKNAQNNTSWSDRAEIKRKKNGSRSRFHADEHQKSCKQILFLVFVSPTGKFYWIPIAFPFKKTTSLENHLKITTHYSLQIVICDFDNRWKQEKGVKTDEWRAVFFSIRNRNKNFICVNKI